MFSALLITLREGLEAALIVGIILGYLKQVDRRDRNVMVWAGVGLAVAISALLAVGMRIVGAQLEEPYEQIFEGSTMLLAVGVLTWMIFWMRYQARFIKKNLERRMANVIGSGQAWGLFALIFLAVFREGLETALFLAANAFAADGASTLIGAVIGLAIAAAVGAVIYNSTVRLNVNLFFNVTSVLLMVFAAGLLAHGVHEFQEIGWLPILDATAWDTRWLLDKSSVLGSILRSIAGYNDRPTLLEVVAYGGYWVVVLQAVRWWSVRLSARLRTA